MWNGSASVQLRSNGAGTIMRRHVFKTCPSIAARSGRGDCGPHSRCVKLWAERIRPLPQYFRISALLLRARLAGLAGGSLWLFARLHRKQLDFENQGQVGPMSGCALAAERSGGKTDSYWSPPTSTAAPRPTLDDSATETLPLSALYELSNSLPSVSVPTIIAGHNIVNGRLRPSSFLITFTAVRSKRDNSGLRLLAASAPPAF